MFVNIIQIISKLAIPLMIVGVILHGIVNKVKVYESFTDGAKDGFTTTIRIIPFFIAMLVAVGVFTESGAMDLLIKGITPLTSRFNIPGELIPMMFLRPISAGGAQGLMIEMITKYGPESLLARTSAVMMGSTETTFYILSVYFGSVYIKKQRHGLAVGLTADLAGLLAAIFITRIFFA